MTLHSAGESLHFLSITQAAELVRSGKVSPVELTRACLDRIERFNDALRAFITITPEQALADARQAEREIGSGAYRGMLHGIPIAHKDIVATRGVRTTAHSNQLRDWVPEADATVYGRLRAAGAISLGKLSCWEFAYGNPGATAAFPPARNPWDTRYSPGGSSSGSGAAVAAGLCFGATGTDTGGSIRHPAAVCGIVGMKTTFGRVSVAGVLPLAPSLDTVGPMTRTVRDNACMLQVMAGHDPADVHSAAVGVPDFCAGLEAGIAGVRIGVPRSFMETSVHPHEPECVAAFAQALDILAALGAKIVDIEIPLLPETPELGTLIMRAEAYAYHAERLAAAPGKFDASLREQLLVGSKITADELSEAYGKVRMLKQQYATVFDGVIDVIASPGREGIADSMEVLTSLSMRRQGSTTRMYNLAGLPALVMPMGAGAHGMPLGIQFAGPAFSEDLLYRVGAAFEPASRFQPSHPPEIARPT